jgi:hypothetical protein
MYKNLPNDGSVQTWQSQNDHWYDLMSSVSGASTQNTSTSARLHCIEGKRHSQRSTNQSHRNLQENNLLLVTPLAYFQTNLKESNKQNKRSSLVGMDPLRSKLYITHYTKENQEIGGLSSQLKVPTRTLKTISLRDMWSTGHCAHLEILALIHHKHLENHYKKKHVNASHCAHFIGHWRILDCPNFSLAPNQAQGHIPNKFHKK